MKSINNRLVHTGFEFPLCFLHAYIVFGIAVLLAMVDVDGQYDAVPFVPLSQKVPSSFLNN